MEQLKSRPHALKQIKLYHLKEKRSQVTSRENWIVLLKLISSIAFQVFDQKEFNS